MTSAPFNLFTPYQLAWGADPSGVRLAEKSRRIGWTFYDAFEALISRVGSKPTRDYDCWYSATDMTAAEEYIGYVSDFAAMVDQVAKVSDAEVEVAGDDGQSAKINVMRVTLANGLRITAGSSNPKFFRSKGGEVKLDELAFHADGKAMFKAAHASARFWGFPLSAWSSHHGPDSYFNKLITWARAGQLKASVHSVNILQAVDQGIVERIRMRREKLSEIPPVDERYRQEWLDSLRAECPDQDTWDEEYMLVPSTDASSLLTYDLIQSCEPKAGEPLPLAMAPEELEHGSVMTAGFDVGRRKDRSALWVLKKVGDVFVTRMIRVLENTTFSAQEDLLNAVMANRSLKRLCIDETGIGMQLAERMRHRWGHRVEPVTFSAPVKAELAMPLKRLFEDRLVRVPADGDVREDLHKVRKTVTAAGNVRFDAARDDEGHADRFWALALAYHAADDNKRPLPAPLMKKPVGW
jgi:phage FluMu gp28-like protein